MSLPVIRHVCLLFSFQHYGSANLNTTSSMKMHCMFRAVLPIFISHLLIAHLFATLQLTTMYFSFTFKPVQNTLRWRKAECFTFIMKVFAKEISIFSIRMASIYYICNPRDFKYRVRHLLVVTTYRWICRIKLNRWFKRGVQASILAGFHLNPMPHSTSRSIKGK